jgi:signal transduction histidine kinase
VKIKHSTKTIFALGSLVVLAVAGALAAILYGWYMRAILEDIIFKNTNEMLAATELEISLQRQGGLEASYMLDMGNNRWLEEINRLKPAFKSAFENMKASFNKETESPGERALLEKLGKAFANYDAGRDEFIMLYGKGGENSAKKFYLSKVSGLYNDVAALCEKIVAVNRQDIQRVLDQGNRETRRLTIFVVMIACLTSILAIGFLLLLFKELFSPLKQMAQDVRRFSANSEPGSELLEEDDLQILGYYMRMLMTELTEARSSMEQSLHKLHHSERLAAIGNAVAHVSHEIKNRLMLIGGCAYLIEKRPDDLPYLRDNMQIIQQEVRKLEKMLKDMMDFSKPHRLNSAVQPLNTLVEKTMDRLCRHVPEGVKIEISLDPETPNVSIDAECIEQVIINIVRNSIEALQSGGTIKVSTLPHQDGAALIIQDDGPGIPDELQGRIFEPFFTTKEKGNGLGLAVCSQIVDEHSATLRMESAVTIGTSFIIEFPDVRL